MTNKEYFEQAVWLDKKINSYIRELDELKASMASISCPVLGDRVQTSQSCEASFVKRVERVIRMQEKINREIDALVDLKEEIREVIAAVPNINEQMALRYRYLFNMDWDQMGVELGISPRTARRWHDAALEHAVRPA